MTVAESSQGEHVGETTGVLESAGADVPCIGDGPSVHRREVGSLSMGKCLDGHANVDRGTYLADDREM